MTKLTASKLPASKVSMSMPSDNPRAKNVLITGATSGIGLALVSSTILI